jgi:hypothetical protein
MTDLSILVYTNEKNLAIAKLAINQIDKFTNNLGIKKYLVSNSLKTNIDFGDSEFELIDSNITYCPGSTHFSKTLINGLSKIESEYVLFFLDDYILLNEIKMNVIDNLIKIMKNHNLDYLSFMSYDYKDWETLKIDYKSYGLPDDIILKFNYSYLYMFSLQPSIWKVSSLITILSYNSDIRLHQFDTTNVKNKNGVIRNNITNEFWETPDNFWDYGFNFTCFKKTELTKNYAFDERNEDGDYLTFLYSEIVRSGKFNFNTHHNNKHFLSGFLPEKLIDRDNNDYKSYF